MVLAVPCDMEIAGYGTEHVNVLRLWDARSTTAGGYVPVLPGRVPEGRGGARPWQRPLPRSSIPRTIICEGKSLRLKQQYFFVSATLQSIAAKHTELYGTLQNFHEKNVIQINDTHPALVIPELMRILHRRGRHGLGRGVGHHHPHPWPTPTTPSLSEALERWPQQPGGTPAAPGVADHPGDLPPLAEAGGGLLPRPQRRRRKWPSSGAVEVRMANLCIAGGMAVNGVSGLHSEILKKDVFKDAYGMEPWKVPERHQRH